MSQRIIIVGPGASGKDVLKKRFKDRGFKLDVSYTTRPQRDGEERGREYNFISEGEFFDESMVFKEYVKFGEFYYGTGMWEWKNCDVFIMEASAVNSLLEKDRNKCFVIYLNPSIEIRTKRMLDERDWNEAQLKNRIANDEDNFKNFKDFDIEITNPEF